MYPLFPPFPLPHPLVFTRFKRLLSLSTAVFLTSVHVAVAQNSLDFAPEQLPVQLDVGYAVRLLDLNQDQRDDIAIVDSERIIWLENPTWQVHTILEGQTPPDNVCFAPADIDGDGRTDFALGADWTLNTREGGTIHWLQQGSNPGEPWKLFHIGQEPTVHRMRFADLSGDGRPELIVLPLLGRDTTRPMYNENGVRILRFAVPDRPMESEAWQPQTINDQLHVTHNFWPTDLDHDGHLDLLVVSFEGLNWLRQTEDGTFELHRLGEGDQQSSPNRGSSEVKVGYFRSGDGTAVGAAYIATIEPWHGNQVVVYTPPSDGLQGTWKRHLLDDQLKWGHAVWCADLDQDGLDELVIGVRDDLNADAPCGLRVFDPQSPEADPGDWTRTLFDPGGVNIEDLAVADLNGDGRPDIVAVGRQSHNARIYWNRTTANQDR